MSTKVRNVASSKLSHFSVCKASLKSWKGMGTRLASCTCHRSFYHNNIIIFASNDEAPTLMFIVISIEIDKVHFRVDLALVL